MRPSDVRAIALKEMSWQIARLEEDVDDDLRKTLVERIEAIRWLLEKVGLYDEVKLAKYVERARAKRAA